jgi:actin-related protein 8
MHIMNILFNEFCFQAAMVHQESLCNCFGANLLSACVVDIGHTVTSVCCIDEGTVFPRSRVFLNYGGQQVSESLLWFLKNSKYHHFPYRTIDMSDPRKASVIERLKEKKCHTKQVLNVCHNY